MTRTPACPRHVTYNLRCFQCVQNRYKDEFEERAKQQEIKRIKEQTRRELQERNAEREREEAAAAEQRQFDERVADVLRRKLEIQRDEHGRVTLWFNGEQIGE